MNIFSQRRQNTKVKIVDILSELTGNAAISLQRFSYKYLDEGKCYLLLNLKHVRKIDGLGIRLLEQFVNRGVHIRLFNVGENIRYMLKISGKEPLFKIYNVTDSHEAVSLFEKEKVEGDTNKFDIKKRHFPRVNTLFLSDFKYRFNRNGVFSGKSIIRNLSEGGAFMDEITSISTKIGEIANLPEREGQELYDFKFRITGTSKPIEAKGGFVREYKTRENRSAGIRFKDMEQDYKEMIRDYVARA